VRHSWFQLALLCALGAATTLVLAVLLAQIGYSGLVQPLTAMGDLAVWQAIWLSFFCATVAASLAIGVAIPSAYALARWQFPGKTVVDALLDVPVVLSPIALGLSLLLLFRTAPGVWIQTYVVRFVFEVPGIILAQFILALALSVRVLKATFEDVDVRMEQVARFLGCSPWKAFCYVVLPLSRSGLLAAFILGWARALGDFGASVTIAGAVKGKTETIPISIYLNMASVDLERAVALMLVLSVTALVVLVSVRLLGRKAV